MRRKGIRAKAWFYGTKFHGGGLCVPRESHEQDTIVASAKRQEGSRDSGQGYAPKGMSADAPPIQAESADSAEKLPS